MTIEMPQGEQERRLTTEESSEEYAKFAERTRARWSLAEYIKVCLKQWREERRKSKQK